MVPGKKIKNEAVRNKMEKKEKEERKKKKRKRGREKSVGNPRKKQKTKSLSIVDIVEPNMLLIHIETPTNFIFFQNLIIRPFSRPKHYQQTYLLKS